MKKDEEYGYYRELYIKEVSRGAFPWRAVYYYYMQNIDRIDVMGYQEFQEHMLLIEEATGKRFSTEIYQILDGYYNITEIINKNNQIVKLV